VHNELVDRVTCDGRRWVSETKVAGESVIRVMIISYLTGEKQLVELQQALHSAATAAMTQSA